MSEKLVGITSRLSETVYAAAIRWVGNYNAAHSHDPGFQALNFSDVVRLGVQTFISSVTPQKFFLPKDG
jgi:hypothetical protein